MPVDVPRCFCHAYAVDITEQQRAELATQVEKERIRQFGAKSAAYKAAGVNSATWDRIEAGERVRPDRLIAAVRALWPSSGGDWTRIGESPEEEVSLAQRVADLEDRVTQLEKGVRNHGSPASTSQAAGSAASDGEIEEVNGDTLGLSELGEQHERQAGPTWRDGPRG